jgi:hypothetical protein
MTNAVVDEADGAAVLAELTLPLMGLGKGGERRVRFGQGSRGTARRACYTRRLTAEQIQSGSLANCEHSSLVMCQFRMYEVIL